MERIRKTSRSSRGEKILMLKSKVKELSQVFEIWNHSGHFYWYFTPSSHTDFFKAKIEIFWHKSAVQETI